MAKYKIEITNKFKKDYNKMRSRNNFDENEFKKVIELLAKEEPLPSRFKDHKLKGGKEFENCRECHIEPDWLLVYRILKTEIILELLYTGTHSDLF